MRRYFAIINYFFDENVNKISSLIHNIRPFRIVTNALPATKKYVQSQIIA